MKSRKILSLLMMGVITASLFAGCGKGKSGKTELELFSTKSENVTILKKFIADYESKNPNVKIKLTAPSDPKTVLKTRLTKNELPDFIAMGGDATFKELQSAGTLEDLSSQGYVKSVQKSYMDMVKALYGNDKVYGVPYATNASGVLYNKDIFAKENLKVPQTWDEFKAVVKKLEDDKIQPFELTFKDAWTCLPIWNSMVPDMQPQNFLKDRLDKKTTFVDTHKDIATKYLEVLDHAQKDYMGTTYDDGNKMFAQGKAAMMVNGNWAIPEFKKTNKDFNVDMFSFPATNDAAKNYITSGVDVLFAVTTKCKEKDEANKFISFMMTKDSAEKYINDQFAFSAITGVDQNDKAVASMKQGIADGKVSDYPDHAYPSGFDLQTLLSKFALNHTNKMANDKNIDDLLKNCDKAYDTSNVK